MPELVLRRFLLVLLVLLVFLLLLLLLLPLLLLVPFPFLRSLWLLALRRYWRVLLLRLRHFVWCRSLRLRLLWLPVWLLTLVLFWPLVRCRLGRWRTILSGRWFTRSIGVGPVRLRSVRRRAICVGPVRLRSVWRIAVHIRTVWFRLIGRRPVGIGPIRLRTIWG